MHVFGDEVRCILRAFYRCTFSFCFLFSRTEISLSVFSKAMRFCLKMELFGNILKRFAFTRIRSLCFHLFTYENSKRYMQRLNTRRLYFLVVVVVVRPTSFPGKEEVICFASLSLFLFSGDGKSNDKSKFLWQKSDLLNLGLLCVSIFRNLRVCPLSSYVKKYVVKEPDWQNGMVI